MSKKENPIKRKKNKERIEIFKIKFSDLSQNNILEKIKNFLKKRRGIFHVVSLNPEILVIADKDKGFKEILKKAQIKIVDGIGVVLATRLLSGKKPRRITGVDLFQNLLSWAGKKSLKILLIGGKGNLADSIAECYQRRFKKATFVGIEGFKDIRNIFPEEESKIFSIVADLKPHFVFVAFGSPFQEKWIWKNREKFEGVVVMGVGGAFDYLGGRVPRPPKFLRRLGLEWLWRLILQPWRAKRQVRLLKFVFLVFREAWRKRLNRRS